MNCIGSVLFQAIDVGHDNDDVGSTQSQSIHSLPATVITG